MTGIFARRSQDPKAIELRRLALAVLVLLATGAAWHSIRDDLVYEAARSSIGCPGRAELIAAALRQAEPRFPDQPQLWTYDLAHPGWIAWSSMREVRPLANGPQLYRWQVNVADQRLEVKGVIAVYRLSVPPVDADGDGSCEVVTTFYPAQDDPQQDLRWWAVARLGDEYNQVVWAGMIDDAVWQSRRARVRPVWRDADDDGTDELVFITVETVRTPQGNIGFKPPQTVAVFGWDSPGGILRPRLLPEDCGITPWSPVNQAPLRFGREEDPDPIVRELLPVRQ